MIDICILYHTIPSIDPPVLVAFHRFPIRKCVNHFSSSDQESVGVHATQSVYTNDLTKM